MEKERAISMTPSNLTPLASGDLLRAVYLTKREGLGVSLVKSQVK